MLFYVFVSAKMALIGSEIDNDPMFKEYFSSRQRFSWRTNQRNFYELTDDSWSWCSFFISITLDFAVVTFESSLFILCSRHQMLLLCRCFCFILKITFVINKCGLVMLSLRELFEITHKVFEYLIAKSWTVNPASNSNTFLVLHPSRWYSRTSLVLRPPRWYSRTSLVLHPPMWYSRTSLVLLPPRWYSRTSQVLLPPRWYSRTSQVLLPPRWYSRTSLVLHPSRWLDPF